MERRGWCVFSSTMEDVPGKLVSCSCSLSSNNIQSIITELYDDGKLAWQLAHMDCHGRSREVGSLLPWIIWKGGGS